MVINKEVLLMYRRKPTNGGYSHYFTVPIQFHRELKLEPNQLYQLEIQKKLVMIKESK